MFVQRHDYSQSPLFLYLAYTAPHWPLHALQADIDKYKERYKKGWDVLRAERFARQKEMGLFGPDVVMNTRDPEVPAWETLTAEQQEEFAMRMAIYAAQIDAMDQGIGRLVDELEKQGQLDNTVIMFLSDNGACAEFISSGQSKEVDGTADTYESYRKNWANLSSTPYREYKHHTNEGGIATPMIVHYPNGIPSERNNTFVNEYGHITDIMATCVDLAGAEYPKEYKGHAITPMQGVSLRPNFTGNTTGRGKTYWEHEGNIAVRDGKWKIVTKTLEDEPFDENGIKLYDMEADPTELHDLSAQYPDKKASLYADWKAWAESVDVFPIDTRAYGKRQQDYKRDGINGEFDYNYGDWGLISDGTSNIVYSIDTENTISGDKTAKIEVLKPGEFPRNGQLKWEFQGEAGETVKTGFKIRSDAPTSIFFRLEYVPNPGQKQIDETVQVTGDIQSHFFESTPLPANGKYQLVFYVGKASGTIWIDQVTMDIQPAPLNPNVEINGEFDADYENWRTEFTSPAQIEFGIETDQPISGEKTARIKVLKKGDAPRYGMLAWNFSGEQWDVVRTGFKVRSSQETTLFFRLEYINAPGQKQIDETIHVTPETKEYTFDSKPLPYRGNYQLVFYVGQAEGTIWIDAVTLQIGDSPATGDRQVALNDAWMWYDREDCMLQLLHADRVDELKIYNPMGISVMEIPRPASHIRLNEIGTGMYMVCIYSKGKLLHQQKILVA